MDCVFVWDDCDPGARTVCACAGYVFAHIITTWIGLNRFTDVSLMRIHPATRPTRIQLPISPSKHALDADKFIINIEMEFLACLWHSMVNLNVSARANGIQFEWKQILCSAFLLRRNDRCSIAAPFLLALRSETKFHAKNCDEKIIPLSSATCDARNADCRLQSSLLVLWPSVPCQKCKYKSFDHQKARWREIVCHSFPFKRFFSFLSRPPNGNSMPFALCAVLCVCSVLAFGR